jgi:hypothetical protein
VPRKVVNAILLLFNRPHKYRNRGTEFLPDYK